MFWKHVYTLFTVECRYCTMVVICNFFKGSFCFFYHPKQCFGILNGYYIGSRTKWKMATQTKACFPLVIDWLWSFLLPCDWPFLLKTASKLAHQCFASWPGVHACSACVMSALCQSSILDTHHPPQPPPCKSVHLRKCSPSLQNTFQYNVTIILDQNVIMYQNRIFLTEVFKLAWCIKLPLDCQHNQLHSIL